MSRPPDVPRGPVGLPAAVVGLASVASGLTVEDQRALIRLLCEQLVASMGGCKETLRPEVSRSWTPAPAPAQPPRSTRSRYHAPEADR